MPLLPKTIAALEKLIITDFFKGGPKAGHQAKIKCAVTSGEMKFYPGEEYHRYRSEQRGSVRLHWDITVQDTWATSVERRGIALVDGYPILHARKLSTKHWETFEVVALKRGSGFTASVLPGFVFLHGAQMTFDTDRGRGTKRIKTMIRTHTVALLNGTILT